MDNLAPRILNLMGRLSGRAGHGAPYPSPLNQAAIEAAYRQALRHWFELTAAGPGADQAEVARVYQELIRFIDEVGEPRATTLRRQWARDWWQGTGVCPSCGERGPCHDAEGDRTG